MQTDKGLLKKCKRGCRDALAEIYRKYKDDLLRLAVALLKDVAAAEDVVHDTFIAFAQQVRTTPVDNLRGYLLTSVANRAKSHLRSNARKTELLQQSQLHVNKNENSQRWLICSQQMQQFCEVVEQLPFEQREVVLLHLRHGMKFREIALHQNVSQSVVQGRYRYGINKLRSLMASEVTE